MTTPNRAPTAKSAGYRMPPEWAPHERTWMQWPYRDDFVWPDIAATQAAYARVAKAIRRFEPLTMMVREADLARATELCGDAVDYFIVDLDDSWARDSGPNFVKNGDSLAASLFHFNAWGEKYDRFRNDAAIGHRVAEALQIPTFTSNVFMEGGGISVDGEGTILTSEQCILNPNRNPGLSKTEAESILCEALGGETVIWVAGDPCDNETDGHIDGIACFTAPGVVLCEVGNSDYPDRMKDLAENRRALELAKDAKGRELTIIDIDEAYDAEAPGDRFCRSFINSYIVNGAVIVPEYGTRTDIAAQGTIQSAFPDREIVPVNIDDIAVAGGGIHCITQQQPK